MAVSNTSGIDFAAAGQAGRPYEEEALFARDVDGRLIRVEKATASDFDTQISLKIDGHAVAVPKAVPTLDSQGNIVRGKDGQPIPRFTTIYDAAAEVFVKSPGDKNPIPTLCHKEYLQPVGMCRVCIVEAVEMTRRGPRKSLVPSCVQRVSDGMEVHTICSVADPEAAQRVRSAASVVTELLISDHLPLSNERVPTPKQAGPGNELARVAEQLNITQTRYALRSHDRGHDNSSQMIQVDHNQCIMCNRCDRGCNGIKKNNVIGRSGKGYEAKISFDLDNPMGSSSCVSCGECAVSCPTGALEFKPEFLNRQIENFENDLAKQQLVGQIIRPEELIKIPLFSGIPFKFLQFNASSVVRRQLKPGEVLCREGEHGATAFIIVRGKFEIFLKGARGAVTTRRAGGLTGFFGGLKTMLTKVGGEARLTDVGAAKLNENQRLIRTPDDVILGEMTCMNRYPRSATVVAIENSEVLEIRRNVLYMLQRNETSRGILEKTYRERSLYGQLEQLPILKGLDIDDKTRAIAFLRNKVDLISVDPGQTIFKQGDVAEDFYVVKLGFVKVTQRYGRDERVLNYIGPGNYFGEIGLLSQVTDLLQQSGMNNTQAGLRTASCYALDHVELVRITGKHFRELLEKFPKVRDTLVDFATKILERDVASQKKLAKLESQDFLDQGLYLAQSLLVLDLDRCTRCDECTKACADTHDGVTRLVREGMRFDKYLVASSCRSCLDPYCLVGCPVDAIHRNGDSLEIQIEDYCIGCGLCAGNCPYGNINMHGFRETVERDGKKVAVVQQRATTCDLCTSIDGKPSCVYACPHNAAFRMTGEQLLNSIQSQRG